MTVPICTRLPEHELAALDSFAERLGLTRSKAVRAALAVADSAPDEVLLAARDSIPLDRSWRPRPHKLDVEAPPS